MLHRELSIKPGCNSEHRETRHRDVKIPLKSLENWTEFLDRPAYSIFKAKDNWQARLAATVLGKAQNSQVLVVRPDVCWKCVRVAMERGHMMAMGYQLSQSADSKASTVERGESMRFTMIV